MVDGNDGSNDNSFPARKITEKEHINNLYSMIKTIRETQHAQHIAINKIIDYCKNISGEFEEIKKRYGEKFIEKQNNDENDITIDFASTGVSFSDIGGLDQVIEELRDFQYGIQFPENYKFYGTEPSNGVLLYGQPGCGKTMLIKALATETDCYFFEISIAGIMSKFVGEAEKNLENIFIKAGRKYKEDNKKVILFFDEAETTFPQRGMTNGHLANDRLVNTALRYMDGMADSEGLIFTAATNYKESIDEAILNRFRMKIEIPRPNKHALIDILQKQIVAAEKTAGRQIYLINNYDALADLLYDRRMVGRDIRKTIRKTAKGFVVRSINDPEGTLSVIDQKYLEATIRQYAIKRDKQIGIN